MIGPAIARMSASWSPSWRKESFRWRIEVSRLIWPETTTMPRESVQAPKTPFSALIPPGPVVTLTAASRPERRK